MRKFLKFALVSALVLFVGVPVAFVLFVMVMALFGVVIGIGGAILGMIFSLVKLALMILIPVALLVWVAKRFLAPERTY